MTRDPFEIDRQQRERLQEEVFAVRLALWEAKEARDGAAALAALDRMYVLVERHDAKVLVFGDPHENVPSFSLPATCKQMTARHYGRCAACEGPIKRGDVIYWEPTERATFCVACGGIPGIVPQPDGR